MATTDNTTMKVGHDIEAGSIDGGALRWAFVRKVYGILVLQLLLTVAIASAVILVGAIPKFILFTTPGFVVYIITLIAPLIVLALLHANRERHPVNLVLLILFTIVIAFGVGLSCSFSHGKVILLAGILTSVVFVTLTLYTFWAAKMGYDFHFMGPFLFTSLLVLILFSLIQVFIPFGNLGSTMFGGIAAIVFSGLILYDTDDLIKRFNYDQYIWASIGLYLDIANLFLAMLGLGGGCN